MEFVKLTACGVLGFMAWCLIGFIWMKGLADLGVTNSFLKYTLRCGATLLVLSFMSTVGLYLTVSAGLRNLLNIFVASSMFWFIRAFPFVTSCVFGDYIYRKTDSKVLAWIIGIIVLVVCVVLSCKTTSMLPDEIKQWYDLLNTD